MENKKIYEALNTIKDCCKEHDKECEKCPLSVTENGFHKCKVGDISYDDIPKYWNLASIPVYKAFNG